jgi:16S rRNA (cytosine967-C5)-methyltransferase
MIAPARLAAYEMLRAVDRGPVDLASAIARGRNALDDSRDQALASDIATGVNRWRNALDHVIGATARRPVARLDPEILDILRLSVYQLLHLTRVPASAVVDDAVNLARKVGKSSAGGLVNAVLRAISRGRSRLPLPRRPDGSDREQALDYLTITLSHPRWLAVRWLDRLGLDEAEAWMQFNDTPAPLTLRANRLRTTPEALRHELEAAGVDTVHGQFAPDAVVVKSGRTLEREPARDDSHSSGAFVVQDEASQLVTLLAGPRPGPRVLDTCASPGGKATAIAADLDAHDLLVACDVRSRRMGLLKTTVERAGARQVRLAQADALKPLPFRALFDCVIVDAPCSGLGTLRRDPDIKWHRREEDLAPLAERALTMLRHAADCVEPGGRLIYATCSTEPEENEEVAERFARDAPQFRPVNAVDAHPRLPAIVVDRRGHLRTTPRHGLEGFFGAVFERAPGAGRG